MSTFIQKKCPTCGGRLELLSGNQYECRSCHNVYELNERNANLYHDLQVASTFRESLNFKQAELMYKNLLKEYKDENLADVYWNLLLCEQRVMFESNEIGEQFPSFYDIAPTEIEESENYNKTIEYLNKFSPQNIGTYVELVDKMYTAKRKCRTIKNTSKPYDIFICFKKSKLDGEGVTEEYKLAFDLYNILSKDYNVFFSERSLNNIVVREYEPNIYHALYTAKIMLVLCSKREYLESQWVKNEWSRFKMFSTTTSQTKAIIPIFMDGFQENALPDEIRTCQGIRADYSLTESLKSAVKAILNPTDKQAEMAAKLKAEMQEQMKAQMDAQMKAQLESLTKQFGGAAQSAPAPAYNPTPNVKYIVPYGITSILENQFKDNESIVEAIIPDTVTSIGKNAFSKCKKLMKVEIPDSVTNIEYGAFNECVSLQLVSIGKGVQKIDAYAFCKCESLTSIKLPESLIEIANHAFAKSGLASITIPQGVTSIGLGMFTSCNKLTSITVAQGNSRYHSVNNCLIDRDSRTLIATCKNSTIPSDGSVQIIAKEAFTDCDWLTEIIIPDGVTKLAEWSFDSNKNLTKVVIPDSVTEIAHTAFGVCEKLQSVTMGKNVESIGANAFAYCSSLKEILLPHSIKSIGSLAFSNCSALSITYDGSASEWDVVKKEDNWNLGARNIKVNFLRLVPDGTKEIPDRAFYRQYKLHNGTLGDWTSSNVVIPDSVKRIGKEAFHECEEIENVIIGDGVETIGKYAFKDCRNLQSITIGKSVKSFDGAVFWSCYNLKQVHIKDLAQWCNIEGLFLDNPLQYAHNLYLNGKLVTDLVVPEGVSKLDNTFIGCTCLKSVVLPNSITYIGIYTFKDCANIRSISIPNSVKSIESYAFDGCLNLAEVTLPTGFSFIKAHTFQSCVNMTKVSIPVSVTRIGSEAFFGCMKLEHIYYGGTMKQWKAIDKDKSLMHSWNKNTGKYIVHCTDGDLKK
ncbi:MAG: leucine-rich repeat protein [Clostridia bacterium]|nr:leucine-rich repeat protein [Clostridia bacterium]